MDTIVIKLRDLIQDNLRTDGKDTFTYRTSKLFILTEANTNDNIKIYRNGDYVDETNWETGEIENNLTYTGTIVIGDVITVTYSYYAKYSDNELKGYIRSALYYLSVEQYGTFTIESGEVIDPEPTEAQENLIAWVASILMKGNIRSYKTPEFTLVFNEDESIGSKIKKVIRQFQKTYGYLDYIDPKETTDIDDDEPVEP
jgi:hypothetical protein